MKLLGDDDVKKSPPPKAVSVGDIVLLYVEGVAPTPAVVLVVHEDGTLDVNDLAGSYGRQYGLRPQSEQTDTKVLSWVARGGQ